MPKHDSGRTDDPQSRAFVRPHPQRNREYTGKYAKAAAFLLPAHSSTVTRAHGLALCAFVMAAAPSLATTPVLPRFAYISEMSDVSPAFASYDPVSNDALLNAAYSTGHVLAVTITSDMGEVQVPKTYRRAISCPHAEYWREAIDKELAGLIALHTWDLVPATDMPQGSNLMHCHYVFAVKRKGDGSIEKFKARLVADGNTQKYGVDFDRIFATVVKTQTIRLVLIIAAARDYNLTSIDITQAYLQAELKEDLFMRVPPGVQRFDSAGQPLVCKLRRSLYGLKQAGREWAVLFSSFLVDWGMTRSTIDVCLYTYSEADSILLVLIYVDDALIVDNSSKLRGRFVSDLGKRFPTEDKHDLVWILNVTISRDRAARTLTMSQSLYVTDLLTKFSVYVDAAHTRHFDSPAEEGLVLSSDDQPVAGSSEHDEMSDFREPYMSIVGGLLWLANMTRPDIGYISSQLARFLTNPASSHFKAAIRVLLYLRDTAERNLVFSPAADRGFETYVDSSWGTRFSCSGAMLFYHGCLFHFFSKMQRSVTLSSAEAEFFGAMLAAKEMMFVRELLIDLGITLDGPSMLYCDSKSAVEMAFDPVAFKKTKHILRAAEFLRDLVAREVITLRHVPGSTMVADLLTKATSRQIFVALLKLIDTFSVNNVASWQGSMHESLALMRA